MYLIQALKCGAQTQSMGIAITFQDRMHTWSKLAHHMSILADTLRHLTLKGSDRVAILALHSDHYLEFSFAVPWAGSRVVPMNMRWAVAEHISSLNDSEATLLVVDDIFQSLVPQLLASTTTVTDVLFAGDNPSPKEMYSYEAAP